MQRQIHLTFRQNLIINSPGLSSPLPSMRDRIAPFISAVVVALFAGSAPAALLFYDGFDYTPPGTLLAPLNDTTATPNPGLLNSAYGWNWRYAGAGGAANKAPAISGVGLNYNDVTGYSGLQSTAGGSVLFDATQLGSSRIQAMPSAINSGTVYYSCLFKVGDVANLNAVNGMLLGGFVTSADAGTLPGTVSGVLRIRQSSTAGAYNIGVGMNSGTAAGNIQFDTTAHAAGDTVFIVGAYQFVAGANNDVAMMWINPTAADLSAVWLRLLRSPPLRAAP